MLIRARTGRQRLGTFAFVVGVLAFAGCRFTTDAPRPHVLGIVSGDAQTTAAGTPLPEPLVVIVIDQYGLVMANISVAWAIASGGGSLTAALTTTDANGIASVAYTAGSNPGTATITATVSSIGTLTFTETIT